MPTCLVSSIPLRSLSSQYFLVGRCHASKQNHPSRPKRAPLAGRCLSSTRERRETLYTFISCETRSAPFRLNYLLCKISPCCVFLCAYRRLIASVQQVALNLRTYLEIYSPQNLLELSICLTGLAFLPWGICDMTLEKLIS